MSLIAVVGDDATTLSLAVTASLTAAQHTPLLVEFDPDGGSLSAWLDLPRQPGLADLATTGGPIDGHAVRASVQRATAGVEVVVAPARAVEAAAVVQAAHRAVLPALTVLGDHGFDHVVVDGGRSVARQRFLIDSAATVVIGHRQARASAAAAAVRIERLADVVTSLAGTTARVIVALRGQQPYPGSEVAAFVDAQVVEIADDPVAAALLAGRAGSARRLNASALMRSVAALAAELDERVLA
jgi:hypothetical protein